MSDFLKECEKSGGIGELLIKWLLFGGPQRKPGKPQKTFWFRLLWFITIVPVLIIIGIFLLAKDGNIANLKPELQHFFYIVVGILVFDIILWVLRAMSMNKKAKQPKTQPEDGDDD